MRPSNTRMSKCILIFTVVLLFVVGCFAEDNVKHEALDNSLIEIYSPEVSNEESEEYAQMESEEYAQMESEEFTQIESEEYTQMETESIEDDIFDLVDSSDKKPAVRITPTNSFSIKYDYTNYDSLTSRIAPPLDSQIPYTITEARLKEIRKQFMYWYFDNGGIDDRGDHQQNIHASSPQTHENLNFQLPFFGFRFNYTRVSMNGYLEFSDPPERFQGYPLIFPVQNWPKENDPSFIGIFYSKTRIGSVRAEDVDQRRPGVYFRLERDLDTRTDQFGVEMRERVKWDIRESMIGAETFNPKHAITVTWKNMSFAGGIANALFVTNTFQLVLATDEVSTYAIFNYLDLNWTSHTEAGGDTSNGESGIPAYVGFNAGNGTQAFEYVPYSQRPAITDLTSRGCANGFKGRHVFRIDEKIMLGTCVTRRDPTDFAN